MIPSRRLTDSSWGRIKTRERMSQARTRLADQCDHEFGLTQIISIALANKIGNDDPEKWQGTHGNHGDTCR